MNHTPRKITDEKKIKILILYLLDFLDREIDKSTLGEIIQWDGSINYFFFCDALGKLADTGLVSCRLEPQAKLELEREQAEKRLTEELGEKESVEDMTRRLAAERRRERDEMYKITPLGREVLQAAGNDVLENAKDKLLRSSTRLLAFNSTGKHFVSDIEELADGFNLHCAIKDRRHVVMSLSVFLDRRDEAEFMKNQFLDRAEIVYRGAIALLTGEVRYWS